MTKEKNKLTIKDIYQRHTKLDKVDSTLYLEVVWKFHEILSKLLIETGKEAKLPRRLGTLQIKKRETKDTKKIDFHATKIHGVTIYHDNKHSEGYYGTFVWNKNKPQACFSNKQLYKLEPTFTNKRNLSKAIKENNAMDNFIEF